MEEDLSDSCIGFMEAARELEIAALTVEHDEDEALSHARKALPLAESALEKLRKAMGNEPG